MKKQTLLIFFLHLVITAYTQTDEPADSLTVKDLNAVTVKAYRLESSDLRTPLPVTRIDTRNLQIARQQLALNETLASVPGIYIQNAENFAQDIRVSVRGFGARATFGIRGIRLIMDGFPETTPDGQGQVDNIDPGNLESVEVIRGATAGLYGNASGGIIRFNTLSFDPAEYLEASIRAGSFNFQKYQVKTGGGNAEKILYALSASHTRYNGYRDHSSSSNYLFNSGVLFPVDSSLHVKIAVNYVNSPLAKDPGSLQLEDAESNPEQAFSFNKIQDVSEKLWQARLGVSATKYFDTDKNLVVRGFHTSRDFSNKLPGFQGTLRRYFSGFHAQFSHTVPFKNGEWQYAVGIEYERQSDKRKRFDNLEGERGELYEDQKERFTAGSIFWAQQLNLARKLQVNLGLRYDYNRLSLTENFHLQNGETFSRTYNTFNPIAGLSYAFSPAVIPYVSFSTAFETPTLNELYNPLIENFDPNLQPQSSKSFETGIKGMIPGNRIRYELAVYYIRTTDEINPFTTDVFGNDVFTNLGATERKGLETSLQGSLSRQLYLTAHYTVNQFTIEEYPIVSAPLAGNRLPGLPGSTAYMELRYLRQKGLYATLQYLRTGEQFADNENRQKVDPFTTVNLRTGYIFKQKNSRTEVFFGINNLFDTFYFSNIRINAFGNRYFEPAPGRNFVGGVVFRVASRK